MFRYGAPSLSNRQTKPVRKAIALFTDAVVVEHAGEGGIVRLVESARLHRQWSRGLSNKLEA